MQVGKGRMQYMHDTINGKIKASQGVEYINYGHNYTNYKKCTKHPDIVNFKYSTFISNNNTIVTLMYITPIESYIWMHTANQT